MDRLLQRAASPSGAGRPCADGGLAQGDRRREGCGRDGQRCRVAHMPTAAEADAASRCVIERNTERSGFQSRTEIKRSRCAGPLQSYLAEHAGVLAVSTLVRRVATISKAHEARGLPNPCRSEIVRATFRGIKRTCGVAQRQAKPLLKERLFQVLDGYK